MLQGVAEQPCSCGFDIVAGQAFVVAVTAVVLGVASLIGQTVLQWSVGRAWKMGVTIAGAASSNLPGRGVDGT